MPSASPSQYICNMLEEMDQDQLQHPLVVDSRPVEAYSDCSNTYGQSNFDIEDFISDSVSHDNARRQCRVSEYNPGYVNYINNQRQMEYPNDRDEFSGVSYNNGENFHRVPELISYANTEDKLCCESVSGCKSVYSQHQLTNCSQQHDRQYSPYHSLDRKEKTPNTDPEFPQWSSKHPENWNPKEVLDWIFYSAEKHRLDCGLLRAENFRSVTGADLCKMGLEDFKRLEQNYGSLFFDLFRNLCEGSYSQSGHCVDIEDIASLNNPSRHPPVHMNSDPGPIDPYTPIEYCKREIKTESNTDGVFYELQHLPPYDYRPMSQPHYLQSAHQHQIPTSIQNCGSYPNHFMYPEYANPHHMTARQCHVPEEVVPTQIPRRRPGRPRIKSLPTDEELQREKKTKNQHLWEFIYEILMNPMYNPQFVRWENQREGVFRFVQSEAVAQLWGGLKNNENMTYEKLSRAMRHYYKRGILERVEGRRLVYKFSRVAMDRVREKRYSV